MNNLISAILFSVAQATCPITSSHTLAYLSDTTAGVTSETVGWANDYFTWLGTATGTTFSAIGLTATNIQTDCNLSSFPNLRTFFMPGGNAYTMQKTLGSAGKTNILGFLNRDQTNPSAYVGICAGGYYAAMGYYWETELFDINTVGAAGDNYQNFLNYVQGVHYEGPITDIRDEQYSFSLPPGWFRVVNTSNSQIMVYFGGATWNMNQVAAANDGLTYPVLYFNDFWGNKNLGNNMPAAWLYRTSTSSPYRAFLSSVHPEADNTGGYVQPGTVPQNNIYQNYAWLTHYVNNVSSTNYPTPATTLTPIINENPPHSTGLTANCYTTNVLFCDDFEIPTGSPIGVAPGLMYQWNRNMWDGYDDSVTWEYVQPWNVTYVSGPGHSGAGFASNFNTPSTGGGFNMIPASIMTAPVTTASTTNTLTYYYRLNRYGTGFLQVSVSYNGGAYTQLAKYTTNSLSWTKATFTLTANQPNTIVKFSCTTGSTSISYYCNIDDISISHT
ncbi:hypothetical protein HDV04_000814 [Boothiomyces sp. JEL0838]|nr:hypothetical protein HDV04_000814 [Boothiomyces sp. JEL0838]